MLGPAKPYCCRKETGTFLEVPVFLCTFVEKSLMYYGYIRVSSDKQTVENQRFEITSFCLQQQITIDGWIEETISGTCTYKSRKLGKLLRKTRKGDVIICSELSRLGRNLFMIMEILNVCLARDCRLWTIKDGYRLGEDINAKVLAFAFGLSAEIERNLISQRTREALARRKSEGMVLGRPFGHRSRLCCMAAYRYRHQIESLRGQGYSIYAISKKLGLNRNTVKRYIARIEPAASVS